jgi:hypothetical protein
MWLSTLLTAAGTAVITCLTMEAYFTAKARRDLGEYEKLD